MVVKRLFAGFVFFLFLIGGISAQHNVILEPFSAFSWSVNGGYESNSIIIQNSELKEETKRIGFGGGNEYGLLLKKGFDSSNIRLNFGFSTLIGTKQQTHYFENKDSSMLKYNIMDAFQLNLLVGIGFSQPLNKKLKSNTDLMLSLPIICRLREDVIFSQNTFNEQTSLTYKTYFTPGLNIRTGIEYKIYNQLSFKSDLIYTFSALSDRESKIINYSSNKNQSLLNRYPTVSDREVKYLRNIEKIENDLILDPNGFDPNKPSESISTLLPFSRVGISISLIWYL